MNIHRGMGPFVALLVAGALLTPAAAATAADTTIPVLQFISISGTNASPGSTVTVNYTVQDEAATLTDVDFGFRDPAGARRSLQVGHGFTAVPKSGSISQVIPATWPSGTYELVQISFDDGPNWGSYLYDGSVWKSPDTASGPTTHSFTFASYNFTVTGSSADTAPPKLAYFSRTPDVIAPSQTNSYSYATLEREGNLDQIIFSFEETYSYFADWGAPSWGTIEGVRHGIWPTGPLTLTKIELRDTSGYQTTYYRDGSVWTYPTSDLTTHSFDFSSGDFTIDASPPVASGFSLGTTAVDVSESSKTVELRVRVTDAIGTRTPIVMLHGPGNTQHVGGEMTLQLGTTRDGYWTKTVTLPPGAKPGTWTAELYPLSDTLSNQGPFGPPAGSPTSITVTNTGAVDSASPTLVDFDITPATIGVVGSARDVTVTAHVTDQVGAMPPGLSIFQQGVGSLGVAAMALSSGTPKDGIWTATVTFPKGTAAGAWEFTLFPLLDLLSQQGVFGPPPGFPKSVLVDNTAPTIATTALPTFTTASTTTFAYTGTDTGSGLASYDVRYRRAPYNGVFGAYAYPAGRQATAVKSLTLTTEKGFTYCFSARSRDLGGNTSDWSAERCVATALDDRSLSAGAGWTRASGATYYAGTVTSTRTTGAVLTRTGVQARRLALVATRCAACGSVDVYWNGALIKTISLYQAVTAHKQLVPISTFTAPRTGTLTIRTRSTKPVYIDGVALNRA